MNLEKQLNAWSEFANHEKIQPGVLPIIASSWERCWARINPTKKIQFHQLNPDHLLAAQVASFDLISISRPVMEDIYQNIEHSDIAIMLLNGTGYIIDIIAELETRKRLLSEGIQVGALLTEEYAGTNALGLALIERMPVQVLGPEHYCQQFHARASAAAPIFEATGHPLGILGLLSPIGSFESQSLGLMTAGAKAIEAQHQADQLLADYNSQLDELNAILNTVSEGILVWNRELILIHINHAAASAIDTPPENIVGSKIGDIISYQPMIREAMNRQEPLTDIETSVSIGQRSIACVLSLRFVYRKSSLNWIIVSFRQVRDVRQLVQRQVGANALLTLEDIPGESPQMKRVHNFVKSVAPAMASVLIRGNSGTGKNVLAGAIHNESPRRDGPFLIFPCSTIPNELMVMEMLGYEEGSLPKRAGGRPSKFELANGGTIFFQDVDALSLDAQAILLNALEMQIIQRVGSSHPVEIDVRVIASTSEDIEKLVADGNFRSDLFYRLSTFTITMPSLYERPKDIPLVVNRILNRLSRQLGQPLAMHPDALEVFKKYPWPGNIREMESVLGRAATQVEETGLITLEHLPDSVRHMRASPKKGVEPVSTRPLNELEREAIVQMAQLYNGNLSETAQALGISRTTLWRRMKEYGFALNDFRPK